MTPSALTKLSCRGARVPTPRQGKMPNEENASLWMPLKNTIGAAPELGGAPQPSISTRNRTNENQVFALSGSDTRCLCDDHASRDHLLAVHTIVHCGLRANNQFALHGGIFIDYEMNDVWLGVLEDVQT